MIRRLHHTGFVVRDRARAVAFYLDVVGPNLISEYERIGPGIDQVISYEGAHLQLAILDIGEGHILELIQYLNSPSTERPSDERSTIGASHLAI